MTLTPLLKGREGRSQKQPEATKFSDIFPIHHLKVLYWGKNEKSKTVIQTMVTVHCSLSLNVTDLINLTNLRWTNGWMHQYQGWIAWILRLKLKLVLKFRIILILALFTVNGTERPHCINALTSEIWWDRGDCLYVLILSSCLMVKVDGWLTSAIEDIPARKQSLDSSYSFFN